jgi:flavodoxin
MKTAVRCQSRGGNAKAVADAIAKAAGVAAEPITTPLNEPADLLFVGVGVYALTIDVKLKGYLEALNPIMVKSAAAFTTGGMLGATGKIADTLKAKGIRVIEAVLPMRMLAKNYKLFGGELNPNVELGASQIAKINEFTSAALREANE